MKPKLPSSDEILAAVPAMIYLSNNYTKTIFWCNKTMEIETGYTLFEMNRMGVNFFKSIMHPDDFPQAVDAQRKFSDKEQLSYYGDCRIRAKDSPNWRWFCGWAIPHSYDMNGNIKEVICTFIKRKMPVDTPMQTREAIRFSLRALHWQEIDNLTAKETAILALAMIGHNEKMIANALHYSIRCVESNLANLRNKFNAPNMAGLISKAKEMGL